MTNAFPFAIAVAPNGARRSKADHPRLPMTAAEIAGEAVMALEAGAAMIHLHVRDENGEHTLDAALYREAVAAVKQAVGDRLVIQITTEAVGRYQPAEQMAVVDELAPESASIALRELIPDADAESAAAAFFERALKAGTLMQIIVYEPAELARIADLGARGILPAGEFSLLAVLGRYTEVGATDAEFDAFLQAGIEAYPWMLCAFGLREAEFMGRAANHGGHARIGFENNLMMPDGTQAQSNGALVAAAASAARGSERKPASADDLRRLWKLPAGALAPEQGTGRQRATVKPDDRHGMSGQSSTDPSGNVQMRSS